MKIRLSWSVVFPELLKASVFMPCGGKLSGIVSKNTSFRLLSLDKGIVSEMNCCRGEMLFANEG